MAFPGSSAGKESTCNEGDPSLIPGPGRSPGEGIGYHTSVFLGFPCGSAGKEPTCSAGDLGSISGLGRSLGGEHGNPLQYSWASLVAQLVRNPHAVWETWVPSLGEEDPLEEGMATHSSTFAWRIPWIKEPGGLQSTGPQRIGNHWSDLACTHEILTLKFFGISFPGYEKS